MSKYEKSVLDYIIEDMAEHAAPVIREVKDDSLFVGAGTGPTPLIDSGIKEPTGREVRTKIKQKPAREKIDAVAETVSLESLMGEAQSGKSLEVTEHDAQRARNIFAAGRDPSTEELHMPATMLHLKSILDAYDHEVLTEANGMRNFVTNKLILASDSKNEAIAMRALENLGKLSDVGAFTEKRELTIVDRSSGDLKDIIQKNIDKALGRTIQGEVLS